MSELTYYPMPKRILSPKEKETDKYNLAMAKAIYYNYNSGNDYVCKHQKTNFITQRLYGEGNQPEDLYKAPYILENDNKSDKRKALNNMDYTIVPVAPVIRNSVIALLSEKTNRTNVVFLNDVASDERKKKKYAMQVDVEDKKFIKGINDMRGVKTPENPELPETVKELNMIESIGGIKLEVETALELGIQYCFNYDTHFEENIADTIKGNLFDSSFAVLVDSFDPKTETINVRAANIKNVIIDGKNTYDYEDAQYFGEIRDIPLLDVYNNYKATTGRTLKEEDIIALKNIGSIDVNYDETVYDIPTVLNRYAQNTVRILDFVYLSTDVDKSPRIQGTKHYLPKEVVKESELKSGKIKKDKKGYYKYRNRKQKTLEVVVWRRAKWIIGTKYVYDYGLCYEQVRDSQFKPLKPFHAVRLHGKSIIDIIKPNLDNLQKDILKLQNMKNEMVGYSIAIDFDALTNIKMGGKDYSEKKLLKLHKLKGTLLYRRSDSMNPMDKMQGSPIQEMQGGMGAGYAQLMQDIDWNVRQIQFNTGLNDVALAKTPNPETTYGQAQLAMTGANNAIAHIYKGYKKLKESVAYSIAVRLQNQAKKNKDSKYKRIIGADLWKALGSIDNDYIRKEGIKIIDNPSTEEVTMLVQNLSMLTQKGVLNVYDSFLIESFIKEGKPLKVIAAIMESKIRKREEEQQKSQQMMMQENAKQQQQMQDDKLKYEAAKEQFKTASELKIQADKFDRQSKLDDENDKREAKLFKEPWRNNN